MKKNVINIGLIGLGNVGAGVVQVLKNNAEIIEQKLGRSLILKKVADINSQKAAGLDLGGSSFTANAGEILSDPEIQIVIEAIGGVEPAKEYILSALGAGKHVVTSNKEVLAKFGADFYRLAREKKVYLLAEGSVAGGIPILRPLRSSLSADEILEVYGIINGTTNYILSQMDETGANFEEVLTVAKSLGIAEANPEDDLSGRDAACKAAILARHAFKTEINFNDIAFEGIRQIEKKDIAYARELGYAVKLLAVLKKEEAGQISAMVYPAFVSLEHQLAKVSRQFNAVYIKAKAVGEVMFYGPGAGSLPTGSAVLSDVLEIANLIGQEYDEQISPVFGAVKKIKNPGEIKNKFYIRLWVADRVGVLEKIAGVFAKNNVSINSVIQKAVFGENAEIVIITHEVLGKNIQSAVKEIEKLPVTVAVKNVLRVGI